VEGAEYKDIHDRLDAISLMKSETAEALREKQDQAAKKQRPADPTSPAPAEPAVSSSQPAPSDVVAAVTSAEAEPTTPPQTLEQHVKDLRRQVQRLVKAPGAPLKSAPFHSASTLLSLPASTEVLIVISTAYWYGVETHEGQHGWILRDELEQIP
jgi:hypothetical protein